MSKLEISESAQDYIAELLAKQEAGTAIRIFITQPGTPQAETCISYCPPDDVNAEDSVEEFAKFRAYYEQRSMPFLEDAFVDYSIDRMGGQLTIKAPNSKLPKLGENATIEDKINYVLHSEINPSLAAHGGMVSLVEVVEEKAVLQFGGGCQGCGMVDVTLKEGVEKTLLEKIPELQGVRDVTDHTDRDNAYYS